MCNNLPRGSDTGDTGYRSRDTGSQRLHPPVGGLEDLDTGVDRRELVCVGLHPDPRVEAQRQQVIDQLEQQTAAGSPHFTANVEDSQLKKWRIDALTAVMLTNGQLYCLRYVKQG